MRTAGWFPHITFVIGVVVILFAWSLSASGHEPPDPALCDQVTACEAEWVESWNDHKTTWEAHTLQPRRSSYAFRGMGGGVEQWRPLVLTYFGSDRANTAMCLMSYESGGNPNAKNPSSTAAGLFQFLKGTWNSVPNAVTGGTYESGQVFLPEPNIRAAAWLQTNSGWSQWSPWNAGKCRGL